MQMFCDLAARAAFPVGSCELDAVPGQQFGANWLVLTGLPCMPARRLAGWSAAWVR
jgi:hypothetical protein